MKWNEMSLKAKLFICMIPILLIVLFAGGCLDIQPTASQKVEDAAREKITSVAELMDKYPAPTLTYSADRDNLIRRLKLVNNPNLIGWIYEISQGRVIARYPVKGKVTSSTKRLTAPDGYRDGGFNSDFVGQLPDEMAAYGSSDPYIFFFEPDGVTYHQWAGDYEYCTKPYQIQAGSISVEVDFGEYNRLQGKGDFLK